MKTKGTTKARKLGLAKTDADLISALHYGRAIETEAGKLVVALRSKAASGVREMLKQPRLESSAVGLRRLLEQVENIQTKARRDFTEKSVAAITRGDAGFFRDVAGALELIASANGKPVDKYRAMVHSLWWMLQAAQRTPTMPAIVTNLVNQFPELQGREDDLPRQVRRWCKELGLTLTKGKSVRTGWHRGTVEKELRKLGNYIQDGDKAALLLLNTISPELAKKACQLVKSY